MMATTYFKVHLDILLALKVIIFTGRIEFYTKKNKLYVTGAIFVISLQLL
jgi:hypothetical protein